LGFMNFDFTNTTLGIDLFHESRPFSYFTADSYVGALNSKWFYILNEPSRLYKHSKKDKTDYLGTQPDLESEMRIYVESMLQSTQYLIKNRLVSPKK